MYCIGEQQTKTNQTCTTHLLLLQRLPLFRSLLSPFLSTALFLELDRFLAGLAEILEYAVGNAAMRLDLLGASVLSTLPSVLDSDFSMPWSMVVRYGYASN
jgi:hypothetical protein